MSVKLKERIFDLIIILFTVSGVIVCLVPFLYIIAVSFSSNSAIVSQKITLFPIGFNLETYKTVFRDSAMLHSLFYTIVLTASFTVLSMVFTICAAYPLTKKRLKGRNFLLLIIVITMYFSGGLIPDYLLVKNMHLLDTSWSLILPGLVSVYNMIILKTFFTSLPDSLEESASIDGCTDIGILIKIVLPLSMPVIATLSLFYAVGRWNGFMDALFYISKPALYPIQLKLYQIISISQQLDIQQAEGGRGAGIAPEALKAASVMFATIPILIVYPWLQKYFVSGVMIGAVKG
ncbi:MAG TPA: carbohydrate ABC transporter permease [Clostridiaceae bacterium]